jgi:hypothetical protein
VPGCDRSGWEYQLCGGHSNRWRKRGRLELAGFLADPGPPLQGRIQLTHCSVPGCRFGSSEFGLCTRHRSAWARSGRPDPAAWAAVLHAVVQDDKHPLTFCKSHETRWHQLGCPAVQDYVAHCLLRGRARIDFRRLAPQPRLELPYALQRRHDQQTITAPPPVVNWAIGQVSAAGVGSLLDHSREQRRALTAAKSGGWYQGVRPARPRRRHDTARGHRLGDRVPARRLAAAAYSASGSRCAQARVLRTMSPS